MRFRGTSIQFELGAQLSNPAQINCNEKYLQVQGKTNRKRIERMKNSIFGI